MRLLGGRFFRGGAKRPLFWLCKLGNGARHRAGLEVLFSVSYRKMGLEDPIKMFYISSRLAMGVL